MKHNLFLFVFLLVALPAVKGQASERKKNNFNSEWKLQTGDFPKAKDATFDDSKWKQVTLQRQMCIRDSFASCLQ